MSEFEKSTTIIDQELLEALLNNIDIFYGSESENVREGNREEVKDNQECFPEADEKLAYAARIIANIHGEASFINAVVHMNSVYDDEIDIDRLHEFEEYEKFWVELECFFENEIKRYYKNRDEREDEYKSSIWGWAWEKALKEESGKISRRYRDPLRKRIENIVVSFIKNVCSYEGRSSYNKLKLLGTPVIGISMDSSAYEEINNLIDSFWKRIKSRNVRWKNSNKTVIEFLSFFRRNCPGSMGHLLWIILFLSELLFYRTIDKVANYEEANRRIKELQPLEYWDSMYTEDDLIENYHKLLNNLSSLFFEKLSKKITKINTNMCLCLMSFVDKGESARRDAYDQAKAVFYKFKLKEFYTTLKATGKGVIRCFAVLSNRKGSNFLAISGFDEDLFLIVKTIFMSKLVGGTTYTVIDPAKYGRSEYIWKDSNGVPHRIFWNKVENVCKLKAEKPKKYYRMFSCAERRLVDPYNSFKKKNITGFKIYSRLSPCYMCKRVLEYHKIPCESFEEYTDNRAEEKKYDTYAEKLNPVCAVHKIRGN